MAQLEDSRICGTRERAELPWILGALSFSPAWPRGSSLRRSAEPERFLRELADGFTPFRIDHDEKFNQTTHCNISPGNAGPWVGFNWRYDSGLVAGAVPFADDTGGAQSTLTALASPPISNFRLGSSAAVVLATPHYRRLPVHRVAAGRSSGRLW